MAAALLVASLCVRALRRAIRATERLASPIVIGTLGLLRPRIVISAEARDVMGSRGIVAARLHELAHLPTLGRCIGAKQVEHFTRPILVFPPQRRHFEA